MKMKKEKFLSLLLALSLMVSGMSFVSCSDDDDDLGGSGNSSVVDVPNPAGDDFYMYVNGEWHNSLTETEESQGYSVDVANMLAEMTDAACENMDEYQMVMKSLLNLENGGQQANLDRVEEIIAEIVSGIETEYDAYVAIGKCISMGLLDTELKLYMVYEGEKLRYTFGPLYIEEGEETSASFHKRFRYRKYTRPALATRGGSDVVLSGILEGFGMAPEYFVYDEEFSAGIFEKLGAMSLDELIEYINSCIIGSLYPYCGDDLASQLTAGAIETTEDFLNLMRDQLFVYSIAYQFNQMYITEELKEQFKVYGEELRAAFARRIENNTWLSAETKQGAQEKLSKMNFFFGGPDEWIEEGFPAPEGELLVDDILELKAARTRLIEAMLDKSIYEESMVYIMFRPDGMGLNQYNAGYMSENNSVNVFPAFMIEPEWTEDMDPSEMYAAFYVIGHEITHGFDKEGSCVDAYGNDVDWWTAEDKGQFLALADMLSQQISSLEAAPGIMANGEQTIDEDIADLGGLNIAFDALTEYLKKNGVTGDELKEAQKRFFEKHAIRLCINYSEEELQEQLVDEHSVNKIRVNGMLQHMDAWYELYDVTESDSLYLPAEKRVVIW